MEHTFDSLSTLNIICKEKTTEIDKMKEKEGLISLNFDKEKLCQRANILPAEHDIMKHIKEKILEV
jgi:hypothetical protein